MKNNGGNGQHAEIVASRVQFLGAPPEKAEVSVLDEPSVPVDSEIPF